MILFRCFRIRSNNIKKEEKMYFWKDKKLASALKNDQITEKEQAIYLFLLILPFILMTTYTVLGNIGSSTPISYYDYTIDVITAFAFIYTIYTCYKINRNNDNKNFVSRYACLSFPITVKFLVLSLLLFVPAMILDMFYHSWEETLSLASSIKSANETQIDQTIDEIFDEDIRSGPFTVLYTLLLYLYAYWRYTVCFKIASGKIEDKV